MKKALTIIAALWGIIATAQSVTGINPNQAYKGQSLPTTITSSGLFTSSSSPQGNIQDIILKNVTDSTFAVYDSTRYVNTNTAHAFWNIPSTIGAGLYNLIVRIYNSVTHTTSDHALNNGFTILTPATVSGIVFNDLNKNGVKDAGEPGIPGKKIALSPANTFVISDNLGNYALTATNGLDTVAINLLPTDGYRVWTAPAYYLNVTGSNITGKDFALIDTAIVSIGPNYANQGQALSTVITSNGVFTIGSSPQGNIQDILLQNSTHSFHAIVDSTVVVSTTIAKTFWNVPIGIASGIYDLVVSVYDFVLQAVQVYTLSNAFTIGLSNVWPGDADANHVVDNTDLLAIGLAYDSTGATRSGASIVWQAQGATDWLDTLPGGANFKHADCNGDGIVNANDTVAILQNFSLTHNKNSGITAWRSGIPGISLQLSKDTLVNGDTVTVRLLLGDSTTSVSNIYGVAFDFNYDPIPFDSSTAAFSFSPSWFGNSTNSISIHKEFKNTGTIKAAITGINHLNRSGLGEIARFRAVITTGNINGKNLSYYKELFYISNIKTTDIHGNAIPLNGAVDSNKVGYIPTGITDIKYSEQIYVSPNPANTRLQVSSSVSLKDIAIIDVTGRVVFTSSMTDSRLTKSIDISSIEQGIYFVLVTTERGKGLSKIVVSR